jgi:hypothetical protein
MPKRCCELGALVGCQRAPSDQPLLYSSLVLLAPELERDHREELAVATAQFGGLLEERAQTIGGVAAPRALARFEQLELLGDAGEPVESDGAVGAVHECEPTGHAFNLPGASAGQLTFDRPRPYAKAMPNVWGT